MDGSIAYHVSSGFKYVLMATIIVVSFLWLITTYFVSTDRYNQGYLKGQIDYRNGIIKIKNDTTINYKLK